MLSSSFDPSFDLSEVRKLEDLAFAGWPALETREVAGWRLRFSGGYTKRANSINALGRESQIDRQTLEIIEAAYRERGQVPIWRLTPLAPASIADVLEARGYRASERSLVQVCQLRGFIPAPEVHIHSQPTESWIEAFAAHSPVRLDHRAIMRRMLTAIAAPVGFALVAQGGQPMAMAIAAVNGDHMGLFDVLVMPTARRRGLARKVTESLYAWAWDHGARFAYLQVVATNAAAMPLYAAQGFRTAYDYQYFVPQS